MPRPAQQPLEPHLFRPSPISPPENYCKSSACGSESPPPWATPSLPASFGPPASSRNCCQILGSFSACGLSADFTLCSAHPPWPSLVQPFLAAAANIISRAAPSATTLASSLVGATGFPVAARSRPSPSS